MRIIPEKPRTPSGATPSPSVLIEYPGRQGYRLTCACGVLLSAIAIAAGQSTPQTSDRYRSTVSFDAHQNSYVVSISGNVATPNVCLVHYTAKAFYRRPVDGTRALILTPPITPKTSRTIRSHFGGLTDFRATVTCSPQKADGENLQ